MAQPENHFTQSSDGSINNHHRIYQTDESITVICSEAETSPSLDEKDQSKDSDNCHVDANEPAVTLKIIETNATLSNNPNENKKEMYKKKAVSFEDDEKIKRFTSGDEIVDKRNPFRSMISEDISEVRKISRPKKSGIPTPMRSSSLQSNIKATDETDFISKEEILKQSKYVPVYIKNPDRVLTYSYTPPENVPVKTSKVVKKGPVPAPRKPVKKPKERKKPNDSANNIKYPDLADIKVKVGTEIDESLYDPNEVVLNAKKFDSLYKNAKFDSIDDIDKIVELDETADGDKKSTEIEQPVDDSKKSYTNTINSKEFREYLKTKGLLLFPTLASKPSESKLPVKEKFNTLPRKDSAADRTSSIDTIAEDPTVDVEKKKTVLSRLSSIFTKKKTTPKSPEITAKHSFDDDKVDNGSLIKRVVLERRSFHNDGNRSVLANNEFLTSRNFLKAKNETNSNKANLPQNGAPSISKPVNGIVEDQPVDRRNQLTRRNNIKNDSSTYRNIDLNRSKLYASMREPLQKSEAPSTFDNRQLRNVIQRPQPRTINVNQSPSNFNRNELSSAEKIAKNNSSIYATSNSVRNHNNNINNVDKLRVKEDSQNILKNSEIDPFTFAKIQEIKKKTDEVLLTKQLREDNEKRFNEMKLTNQNFVRNSRQRSTLDGYVRDRTWSPLNFPKQIPTHYLQSSQAPRSQSVLDNMTGFKNSLYGEVIYRQPNSSQDVNVIMRRPSTSTLDKKQIMDKIYDYYRKSVDNSPVPFQKKNYQFEAKSKNLPKASTLDRIDLERVQNVSQRSHDRSSNLSTTPTEYYSHVPRAELYSSPRRPTVSDTDSEFAADSISSRDNYARYVIANNGSSTPIGNQSYQNRSYDQQRIYDVVNSSPVPHFSNGPPRVIYKYASPVPSVYLKRPDSVNSNGNQIYRTTPKQELPLPSRFPPQNDYSGRKFYLRDSIHKPSAMKLREIGINNVSRREAGNVHAITPNHYYEEDYQNEKANRNLQNEQAIEDRNRRSGGRREDKERDLRRHTMGSDMMHYGNQGGSLQRSMDLEMGQPQKSRKGIPIRAYTPQHQGPLFDDDPGIMSEVETASTGFRRGGKQRSSLPVVRTPSKTLERPLGLVFLQYRSETKRALLPNEITSIDTVRALFVRSFPRQLSMIYLEGPNVKIYIHDSSKDMFYELEDVRSHLREIRDRSVLRLFESNEVAAAPQILSGSPGIPQPLPQQSGHWDQDPSYFSEPEFDTDYRNQHIHKNKVSTLPRGHVYNDRSKNSMTLPAKPLRSYGSRGSLGQFPYPSDQLYSIPDGYMSSPERGTRAYEEPYYTQYGSTRGSSITPVIDEEQNGLIDDQYSMYSVKVPNRISRNPNQMYDTARPEELHRIRVEHMERQLANLTGLVQKALVQNPQATSVPNPQLLDVSGGHYRNDKSVSFEKSVSFSDDIQGVSKAHTPQHMADSKPPKPAIKSSTLPRTSSQERDRLKPAPPMKQPSISNQYRADLTLAPEAYNHLRGLQKKAKDLRMEVKTLRRLAQTQAVAVREDIKDTFMRIRATLLASSGNQWSQGDQERTRISREEEIYKQEVIRLEKDLADLEGSVEVLRGEVINRRTRVNMAAVEDMALVLSRASKTVAELKMRFPSLQQNLRTILSNEMERVCREETFLKDEPDRLEVALRRCKKLTGTLVTLKRLASVQEQRTCVEPSQTEETPNSASDFANNSNKPIPPPRLNAADAGMALVPENALDALLDELQTFSKPLNEQRLDESATSDESLQALQNTVTTKLSQSQLYPETGSSTTHGLRRLHSYPSGSDTDQDQISPPRPTGKPPVPERNSELLQRYGHKKLPPPPPPRSSSTLESPTSPNLPPRPSEQSLNYANNNNVKSNNYNSYQQQNDPDSGSESNNSQDNNSQRQLRLEMRHQELLKKQKQLQEQYQRLQHISKNSIPLAPEDMKKHEGDPNLSGSMRNLYVGDNADRANDNVAMPQSIITTNKVYETDIL